MTEKTINCANCAICSEEIGRIGIQMCDRCRELDRKIRASLELTELVLKKIDNEELQQQIEAAPELARKIVASLEAEKETWTDD